MDSFNITTGAHMSRRRFLRNAGIAMSLPMLDSMTPAFAAAPVRSPKRFVGISLSLGLHGPRLVPKTKGRNYEPSPYLRPAQDLRDDFTIISGSSPASDSRPQPSRPSDRSIRSPSSASWTLKEPPA